MKVVYVKYRDPAFFFESTNMFTSEEVKDFSLAILNIAGVLIHEDEEKIVLGEVQTAKDNPKLSRILNYPLYRYVVVIDKKSIIKREDFEVDK